MRKTTIVAAVLLIAACSSSQQSSTEEPEITIVQLSSVSPAASQVTGGVSVEFGMKVKNTLDQPITLKRVEVKSQGYGAYDLPTTSIPFNEVIPPGMSQEVTFMGAANIATASMVGANGPVTLRALVQFDSPAGGFRTVVVQNVHSGTGLGQ
jgi:hypothetical protein